MAVGEEFGGEEREKRLWGGVVVGGMVVERTGGGEQRWGGVAVGSSGCGEERLGGGRGEEWRRQRVDGEEWYCVGEFWCGGRVVVGRSGGWEGGVVVRGNGGEEWWWEGVVVGEE